jgi:hypothetical protein
VSLAIRTASTIAVCSMTGNGHGLGGAFKVVGNHEGECHQEESGEKRPERTHCMLIDERRQKEGSDHGVVSGFSFVLQWTRTCRTFCGRVTL